MVGKDKNKPTNAPRQQIPQNTNNSILDKDYFTPKQEKLLKGLKNWGLVAVIIAVVGYAVWRLLSLW